MTYHLLWPFNLERSVLTKCMKAIIEEVMELALAHCRGLRFVLYGSRVGPQLVER